MSVFTKLLGIFAKRKTIRNCPKVEKVTVDRRNLEIVKTRNLFLKGNEPSNETILTGDADDTYFTVCLYFIENSSRGRTHIEIKRRLPC